MANPENEERTLSQKFDKLYSQYKSIVNADETASESVQEQILRVIQGLEDTTKTVNLVAMFSENEMLEELNPQELKFILLPFMLGSLFTLRSGESRKSLCETSKLYFQDFLKRCVEYGLVKSSVVNLGMDERDAEEAPKPRPKTAQEIRTEKIQRLNATKELDGKIEAVLKRQEEGDDIDEETLRDLHLAMLKRSCIQAETDLEFITQEMELISFSEARAAGKAPLEKPPTANPNKPPFSTFIITKSDAQKKVFGLGYPSVPVMTVEELYEERRQAGIWPGGNSHSHGMNAPPPQRDEDEERDEKEDKEDEETRQKQLAMDEWKDDHKRGWGNRANRS